MARTHGSSAPPPPLGQLGAAVRAARSCSPSLLGLAYPLRDDRRRPGRRSTATPTARWCAATAQVVGSSLIGQAFTAGNGSHGVGRSAFQPGRPPAVGDGYDPLATSRLQPRPGQPATCSTPIEQRRAAAPTLDGVAPSSVPPDAVTASGSGLDPHISPAYADEQVARVARERGLDAERRCAAWSTTHTRAGRSASWASPRSTSLELNLALDSSSRPASGDGRTDGAMARGTAAGLPRRRARRRQDLRDARRGAPPRSSAAPTSSSASSRPTAASTPPSMLDGPRGRAPPTSSSYRGADVHRDGPRRASCARRPRSRWSTSSRTPTSPGRATRSAGRTSRSCSTPASTSSPPSTSSTWSRSTTSSRRSPASRSARRVPGRGRARAPTRSSWST